MSKQNSNKIYHAPLSQSIHKEYNKLIDIISLIPQKQRTLKKTDSTGGLVSVVDIIAYQIGWGTLLIEWYETGLKNKMPDMPGEGFSSWDYTGLARHFYEKYHYDGGEKQNKQFYGVVKRILEIAEAEYLTSNLEKTGIWTWCTLQSGKPWPLSKWITVNTVAPYKRASSSLRKFLKTI